MKSSSFCCFRDRWYIMGNKAYNYIFHKVSILLESAGQGNKPSSDSLSFSEKLDAGSGGRGRKGEGEGEQGGGGGEQGGGGGGGRGRGGDAEGVIFLSPFYPPGQSRLECILPPSPPEISFF